MISRMPTELTTSMMTNHHGCPRRPECHNARPFHTIDHNNTAAKMEPTNTAFSPNGALINQAFSIPQWCMYMNKVYINFRLYAPERTGHQYEQFYDEPAQKRVPDHRDNGDDIQSSA